MGMGQHGLNTRPISCSQDKIVRSSMVGHHSTTASRSTKVPAICTRLNVTCGASLPCGPGRAIPPAMKGEHHGILQYHFRDLGIGSTAAAATPASPPTAAPASPSPMPAAPPPPRAVALVDVVAQLEQRAAANPQTAQLADLHRRSAEAPRHRQQLAARKELATELGCPAELMGDSATDEHVAP